MLMETNTQKDDMRYFKVLLTLQVVTMSENEQYLELSRKDLKNVN